MQKTLEKIKSSILDNIYVIHGTETYLMTLVKDAFSQLVPEEEHNLNLVHYNLLEVSLESVIEEAMSMSFFGDKKVIFVDNPYFLTSEKTTVHQDQSMKSLEHYLLNPNPNTILVILAPYEGLDNRKKIVKQLKQVATFILLNPMNDKETIEFVQNSLSHQSYIIDRNVLKLLLERTNYQLSLCMKELDKLYLAALTTKKITKEDVLQLVPKTLEQNVFSLVEHVLKKDIAYSLQIYRELVLQKEEPIKLVALLIGQFRLILQVAVLKEKNYQQSDIVKQLKQHPYRIQLAMRQSEQYSIKYLTNAYRLLATADMALKTSNIEKHIQVEIALLKIMTGEKIV